MITLQQLSTGVFARFNTMNGKFSISRLADHHPAVYRTLVKLAATLGYIMVFSVPLTTVLLSGYLISVLMTPDVEWNASLLVLLGATITTGWATLELNYLRPAPPAGIEITAAQTPALFAMIERRIKKFRAPAIHRVILTEDCSVKVVRTPSNGFLINHHNSLCIGAPLLQVLTQEQFRVALRSAIGQFSGIKDPSNHELSQLRNSWQQYDHYLQGHQSPGACLLRLLTKTYNKLFQPLSVPAAREHALMLDQYALEVIKDIDALAIIAAEVVGGQFLEQCFWPALMKKANRNAAPCVHPFSNFAPIAQRRLLTQDAERWLLKAMTAADDHTSAQPTLAARLATLGYNQLHFFHLPAQPALGFILDDATGPLLKALDTRWRQSIRSTWKQHHLAYTRERQRFDRLHATFQEQSLQGDAAIKYAELARTYLSGDQAAQALQTMLDQNMNNPEVTFQLGRHLLEMLRSEGLRAIEHCMAMDKSYINRASPLLSEFMVKQKSNVDTRQRKRDPFASVDKLEVA